MYKLLFNIIHCINYYASFAGGAGRARGDAAFHRAGAGRARRHRQGFIQRALRVARPERQRDHPPGTAAEHVQHLRAGHLRLRGFQSQLFTVIIIKL